MPDPLDAVSPLDGRYADRTRPLREYVSEAALMRARVHVEAEYVLALADLDGVGLELDADERVALRGLYGSFGGDDARRIKRIETEGTGELPATNHDVKAVEYFVRERTPAHVHPWIHFGLTSEDVTNIAYRLLVRDAIEEVLRPALIGVGEALSELARGYRDAPMLARTHGQPATPTTFGKEMAVFASRVARAVDRIDSATDGLAGKLAGASGAYAAHAVAYPDVDWPAFAAAFVGRFDLEHVPLATQVNPGDDLAELFDALRGANRAVIDLDRDAWLYISDRYLGQASTAGETGSSTMPHKVNPIDFENAEGNLGKANADLAFVGDWITTSRLQRDLTDSTVKRNIGAALAYCLIGYGKTADGLATVVPNRTVMLEDLEATPVVLAEAIQTVLRREGFDDAYERVKTLTRGREVTLEGLRGAVRDLDIDDDVRDDLLALTPEAYTGLADDLVDDLDGDDTNTH